MMFAWRVLRSTRRCYSSTGEITGLYDFHVKHGGKIVNFGGYMLPVQYSDLGIAPSHLHTRKNASLFDVSHMMQTEITGSDCLKYLESLCTADLQQLPPNSSTLTVFTNNTGGVLDDLIITKLTPEHLYVVSNAGMRHQDQKILVTGLASHKNTHPNSNIKIRFFEPKERGLVALQGPKAANVLQKHIDINLAELYFMHSTEATVCGCGTCRVTRCGYTGEDGFEISIPGVKVEDVTGDLLKDEDVKLAGLGARDSLRLEAGLCLYGSDLTASTTPVEAGLSWLVAKGRRAQGGFPGAATILEQLKTGVESKRVGIISEGGPPARHGTPVLGQDGVQIGEVTSGGPSPSLSKNIAMAYVPMNLSKVGTPVGLKVRDKVYGGTVVKMPFVQTNYYTKPK